MGNSRRVQRALGFAAFTENGRIIEQKLKNLIICKEECSRKGLTQLAEDLDREIIRYQRMNTEWTQRALEVFTAALSNPIIMGIFFQRFIIGMSSEKIAMKLNYKPSYIVQAISHYSHHVEKLLTEEEKKPQYPAVEEYIERLKSFRVQKAPDLGEDQTGSGCD